MIEQLNLFTVQPCWRWYREDMCWNCPEFVNHCKKACGTCEECETPGGDWFVPCDYCKTPGRKTKIE